jgi:hypothetical protein
MVLRSKERVIALTGIREGSFPSSLRIRELTESEYLNLSISNPAIKARMMDDESSSC